MKLEQKVLIFNKHCINKNAFHKHKHLIDVDKVDTDLQIWSNSLKKSLMESFIFCAMNKYIKTTIKICNNKVNTNFHGNKMPDENECCNCLPVILSS